MRKLLSFDELQTSCIDRLNPQPIAAFQRRRKQSSVGKAYCRYKNPIRTGLDLWTSPDRQTSLQADSTLYAAAANAHQLSV